MNKKENRMAVRQAAQQAVIRDEQNHRIEHAATNPIKEVLKSLHTTLRGLDAENIVVSRTKYGTNKVTQEETIPCETSGWSIYQSIYSDPFLSGSCFYYDRYGFSIFFSVRKFTGRF